VLTEKLKTVKVENSRQWSTEEEKEKRVARGRIRGRGVARGRERGKGSSHRKGRTVKLDSGRE
jgi:hypothetical protein